MIVTLRQAFLVALVVHWAAAAAAWTEAASAPRAVWVGVVALRAFLHAAVAVLAVEGGRRWTAPLVPVGVVILGQLGVALVGVPTGQLAARGIGPATLVGYTAAGATLAVAAGVVGTGLALLHRRTRRARPAAA